MVVVMVVVLVVAVVVVVVVVKCRNIHAMHCRFSNSCGDRWTLWLKAEVV